MSGRRIVTSTLAGVLAAGLFAGRALASDYQTCFAFDPVFVQGDQRRAASPPRRAEPAGKTREQRDATKPSAPRLSLATLRKALQSAAQQTEKAPSTAASGGDTR